MQSERAIQDSATITGCHHMAICVHDIEAARRFDPEDAVLIDAWGMALAQGSELGAWRIEELGAADALIDRVGHGLLERRRLP